MWATAAPFLWFSLSVFFSTIALLSKQSSRPALCLPALTFGLLSFLHLNDITSDVHQASVLGLFVLIWLAHIINVLLVQKHVIPATSGSQRWHAAYKMLFNSRWLDTSKQAPNIRMRKTILKSHIGVKWRLCPSLGDKITAIATGSVSENLLQRYAFLAARALSAFIIYSINRIYLHCILFKSYPNLYEPLHISDFSSVKQMYLRRFFVADGDLTIRETVLRTLLVFHFVWSAWATFTFLHDALAFIFVGILGLDEPEDWPPLYGALSQAYTIQNFWSRFWHLLAYRTYTSYSTVLSQYVFMLRPRSATDRLCKHFFVFALSGMVHGLVTRKLGLCGYWEDVQWFCLNFVAMAVERTVLAAGYRAFGHNAIRHAGWKFAGYIWVFAFMFWSLPKSQYPKIYCAAAEK